MKENRIFRYIIALTITAFALVTLFMSSSVIFDWFGIREMEGNYVPFIVWTNFIAAFLYLGSAYGLFKSKRWAFWVLMGTAAILFISLIGLFVHINLGRSFEMKTIGAMVFRIVLTIIFAAFVYYRTIKRVK